MGDILAPSGIPKRFSAPSRATAIEYGLIAGLVSVAAIVALTQLGTALQGVFGVVQSQLRPHNGGLGRGP